MWRTSQWLAVAAGPLTFKLKKSHQTALIVDVSSVVLRWKNLDGLFNKNVDLLTEA